MPSPSARPPSEISSPSPVPGRPVRIHAGDLTLRYGEVTAVDGVSFEVRGGETFGLLGPNGAGKTTTLHLLTGVLQPDAGRVLIDGHEDPTRRSVRHRLGVAPQESAVWDELTGEENLALFGRLYGLAGQRLQERVSTVLQEVGLGKRRRQRVAEYSGGMRRRLSLAAALVHDPPVVLLDEPTAGVDPQSRHLLYACISRLREEGRTVLLTTHYMEEAQRLCDRVAILDHGRILDLDTVDRLIERHGGKPVLRVELVEPPRGPGTLPGTLEGRRLTVTGTRPLEVLELLREAGLEVERLTLEQANLEAVFLHLTGRQLRDE